MPICCRGQGRSTASWTSDIGLDRGMKRPRRDPKDIAAQKRAEKQDVRRGPGYEGKQRIGFRKVDDPFDYRPPGQRGKITVAVNELEFALNKIRRLTADQRKAGETFRDNYELAGFGRGMGQDWTRPYVDTSGFTQPEQERRSQAADFLKAVAPALGITGYALVVRICGEGMDVDKVTASFGWGTSKRARLYTGRRLREALTDLAVHLGLKSKKRKRA